MVYRHILVILLFTWLPEASFAGDIRSAFITGPVSEFTAPQGFRVVLAGTASESENGRVIVGLYSRYGRTTEAIPGFAHMSEHLYSNAAPTSREGTFPEGSRSIDSNAQARPDYVSAWMTINRPDGTDAAPQALAERFSAKLWGTEINAELISEQRERVIAELNRGLRSGSFLSQRALEHAFYGNRPLMSEEIALTVGYEIENLLDYAATVFAPENMVLVVAGDFDVADMEATLHEIFERRGDIEIGSLPVRPDLFRPDSVLPYAGPVHRVSDVAEGDWAAAGILAPPRDSADYLAFLVLDQLLLGGRDSFESLWDIERALDSPLGRRLRESGPLDLLSDDRGYGAASPPLAEGDPAFFTIKFAANEMDLMTAPDRLDAALEAVRRQDMNDESIIAARDALIRFYRAWLNFENLRPLSDHLAGMAFNDAEGATRMNTLADEIAAVSPDSVRRVFDVYIAQGEWRFGLLEGVTPEPEEEAD